MMNRMASLHLSDSPGLALGHLYPEEDIQMLLESPTALANAYNIFSASLLDPSTHNDHDLLRQTSLGSPDFSRHLNMAGMFDADQSLQLARSSSLQLSGSFQPDAPLLQQEPHQALPGAAPHPASMSSNDATIMHLLQQRHQQRCAHQNHQGSQPPAEPAGGAAAPTASVHSLQEREQHTAQQLAAAVRQAQQQQQQAQQHARLPAMQVPQVAIPQQPLVPQLPVVVQPPVLQPLQVQVQVPVYTAGAGRTSRPLTRGRSLKEPSGLQLLKQQQQQEQQQPEQPTQPAQQQQLNEPKQQQPTQQKKQKQQPKQEQEPHKATGQQVPAPAAAEGAVSGATGGGVAAAPAASSGALAKGSLVWAKFPRFPWWPAVIISDVPAAAAHGSSSSSGPMVLVRFLGTYDAAWVESGKALSRWGVAHAERSSKTKAAAFLTALREARSYQDTGALPEAFGRPPQLSVVPQPAGTKKKGKQAPAADPAAPAEEHQPDVWSLIPSAAAAGAGLAAATSVAASPAATAAATAAASGQHEVSDMQALAGASDVAAAASFGAQPVGSGQPSTATSNTSSGSSRLQGSRAGTKAGMKAAGTKAAGAKAAGKGAGGGVRSSSRSSVKRKAPEMTRSSKRGKADIIE